MLHFVTAPKARHFDATEVGIGPHMSFPFFKTVLDPSPIIKALVRAVMLVINIEAEAGRVPTKLLFVSTIEVRAPPDEKKTP